MKPIGPRVDNCVVQPSTYHYNYTYPQTVKKVTTTRKFDKAGRVTEETVVEETFTSYMYHYYPTWTNGVTYETPATDYKFTIN